MKTNELRSKYLEFFKSKGHTVCPSDVMVPKWDKTVLFTPAGMNQFKDHFLGKVELEFTRATSAQKCLRTGDTENVGRTAYHHTFFEMLGNFSFGDYFKRDAIHWAWEFLTDPKWLAIDPDRLSVTVYLDDDEAYDIWHQDIGLAPKRITRLDEGDNFWPASAPSKGPDGVCGPCSEIFFQPDDGPECEIWNLVFTQFNRSGDPPDNLTPLPSKNIDTGMGLERTAAVLQGASTNYHIDSLYPIVLAAAEVCGTQYDPDSDNGRRLRRITDHARAVTMAIHENVYPGAQNEESVVRQLLRRAVLQGYEMGLRDPFLFHLVPVVVEQLKEPYPDLVESVDRVSSVIKQQEVEFYTLIDRSMSKVEGLALDAVQAGKTEIDAVRVFKMYTSNGIPPSVAEGVGERHGLTFDWNVFWEEMDRHAEDSGGGKKGVMGDTGPIDDFKREFKSTPFLGYESTRVQAKVCGLAQIETATDEEGNPIEIEVRYDSLASQAHQQIVVLDQTPFYAESGGQVADTGQLVSDQGTFQVKDTQKTGDLFLHFGHVVSGEFVVGAEVEAVVDSARRSAIQRAHTATHILHYALQKNISADAQQRGSRVADDDLRFDYANLDSVSEQVLISIERDTVDRIQEAAAVTAAILPLEDARSQGAMMLFGEKYPDPVRMVSIGEFSKELCGGIHVANAQDIGAFEIVVEEKLSAGTRRVQALTGPKATAARDKLIADANRMCDLLKIKLPQLMESVLGLQHQTKELKKQIAAGRKSKTIPELKLDAFPINDPQDYYEIRSLMRHIAGAMNTSVGVLAERVEQMLTELDGLKAELEKLSAAGDVDVDSLIEHAVAIQGAKLVAVELPSANSGLMRQLIDQLRKKAAPIAVLLLTKVSDDKVLIAAGLSRDLVDEGHHAGNWIKQVAEVVGGRGGGKPDMAQAGGTDPTQIAKAIEVGTAYFQNS